MSVTAKPLIQHDAGRQEADRGRISHKVVERATRDEILGGAKKMTPQRKREINGHVIEEYYWHGEMVVYVDNQLVKESFEKAIERLEVNPTAQP